MSGAYRYLTRLDEYSILVLGLDGSGKTTLLEKLKHTYNGVPGMDPAKIQPTVGVNMAKIRIQKCLLKFLDLGGQSDLRSIWESYFEDAHAILYVVDASNAKRMDEAKSVLLWLTRVAELDGIPILVLANKQDTTDIQQVAQVKEMINSIADCLDTRDVRVMGGSGIQGTGVCEAVDWLFSRIMENKK
ncbi:ADP-ribosylation factor protein 3 [Coemansia brasiliensis]|uniref:ADP-ribosylation factor protein 3 n=1 Tax=Coemansia brasiliensis TaxID=2650707 RepID=A0A9W8I4S5_9FUNG|nr:ADP-ribosylation factor protein 3 [Coemansia brasiliensis]